MYQHPENNSANSKIATEKKRFIKYKAKAGKLQELTVISKMLTKFIAHTETNRSYNMDLTRRLLTTFKKTLATIFKTYYNI